MYRLCQGTLKLKPKETEVPVKVASEPSSTATAHSAQQPTVSPRWRQFMKWSAYAGMGFPVIFVLLFTLAGLLRPGYSAVGQAVSDLGVGSMAWLVDVPLVILGLVVIALAIGFFRATRTILGPVWQWISAITIALPGIGYVAAGIFTEAPSSLLVHWLVGAMLGLDFPIITFLVVGLILLPHPKWHRYAIYSLIASAATVGLVVFVEMAFSPGSPLSGFIIAGLAERVDLVEILAWYVVMGWQLLRGLTET